MDFNFTHFLIIYIIIINCAAYIVMWLDKIQSKTKGNRISENTLFLIAFLFGALGIYLGMKKPVNHKSAKLKFRIGIPIMLVLNFIIGYALFWYLIK